jgi:hypothetical protein
MRDLDEWGVDLMAFSSIDPFGKTEIIKRYKYSKVLSDLMSGHWRTIK